MQLDTGSGHNQGNQSGHLDDDPGCTSCCETWEDWGLGRGCINANTNECLNNERASRSSNINDKRNLQKSTSVEGVFSWKLWDDVGGFYFMSYCYLRTMRPPRSAGPRVRWQAGWRPRNTSPAPAGRIALHFLPTLDLQRQHFRFLGPQQRKGDCTGRSYLVSNVSL